MVTDFEISVVHLYGGLSRWLVGRRLMGYLGLLAVWEFFTLGPSQASNKLKRLVCTYFQICEHSKKKTLCTHVSKGDSTDIEDSGLEKVSVFSNFIRIFLFKAFPKKELLLSESLNQALIF